MRDFCFLLGYIPKPVQKSYWFLWILKYSNHLNKPWKQCEISRVINVLNICTLLVSRTTSSGFHTFYLLYCSIFMNYLNCTSRFLHCIWTLSCVIIHLQIPRRGSRSDSNGLCCKKTRKQYYWNANHGFRRTTGMFVYIHIETKIMSCLKYCITFLPDCLLLSCLRGYSFITKNTTLQ